MSRPLRLEFAQALYHVTSRGDRREPIYVDDLDRIEWLAVLSQVCARFNWRCHAWCLMGNHFHVLIALLGSSLAPQTRITQALAFGVRSCTANSNHPKHSDVPSPTS